MKYVKIFKYTFPYLLQVKEKYSHCPAYRRLLGKTVHEPNFQNRYLCISDKCIFSSFYSKKFTCSCLACVTSYTKRNTTSQSTHNDNIQAPCRNGSCAVIIVNMAVPFFAKLEETATMLCVCFFSIEAIDFSTDNT